MPFIAYTPWDKRGLANLAIPKLDDIFNYYKWQVYQEKLGTGFDIP